jgi:HEAT repeat protein
VTRFVIVVMASLVGFLPPATAIAGPSDAGPVAAWIQRLRSDDVKVRTAAAYGLDISAECLPAERALLLHTLKDPKAFTRQYVAAALGEVRPATEETTKALIAALSDKDTDVREQAAVSLSKIGPTAIPLLFQRLRKLPNSAYLKPHGEATGIAFALSNNRDATLKSLIGFVKEQPTSVPQKKRKPPEDSEEPDVEPEFNSEAERCAAFLLGEIGMPAVPELASLLNDRTRADFVVLTLLRIKPIEVLAQNWNSPEAEKRELSRRLIINSDGTAAGLLEALSKDLSQKSAGLRLAAVEMLGEIGYREKFPNEAMQALGQALSDSDQAVRREAAASLAGLRHADKIPDSVKKQALDALERADKPMRSSLVQFLAASGSREALPEIIRCIRDSECRSLGLAEALGNLAPDAPGLVEAMVTALADKGWAKEATVRALSAFGPAPKTAVAGLTKVLRDAPFPPVADLLAHSGKEGIAALVAILNEPGAPSAAKQDAAAALANVAGENPSIGEALKPFLSHPDWKLRITAAQALANAGDIETVRSFLQAEMKEKAQTDRSEGMELVKLQVRIDPEAAAARLKSESAEVSDIASAIRKTGATNEKFVDPLLTQLSNKDEFARRDAAGALGQFGPFRDRIVPRLLEKLNDPSEDVRDNCFKSLASLVTDPAKFEPLFRKLTNDRLVKLSLSIFFDDLNPKPKPKMYSLPNRGDLPPFPWPPPRYSSIGTFGRDFERKLIGDDETTLGTIYQRLYDALTQCDSNFESGLFGTPGGFALLSKMERIAQDGTPFPGKQRWVLGKIPPQSLSDLVSQLFLEKPGYFRVIAFVVTDEINFFDQGNDELPDFHRGGSDLPAGIASLTMKGRQCYVLVYSFEKRAGSSATNLSPESPNAKLHLVKAGLLDALSDRR